MVTKTITDEQVKNATTYVPIAEKMAFVDYVGENKCFKVFSISYGDEPMPPMIQEDGEVKSRYLLTALLKMYLHVDVETLEDDEWLMPRDEYDRWCGGHIMGQIEKYKANKELRDIIYDMMADYKDLEKRVNLELYGRINVMNDVVIRGMQLFSNAVTPDALNQMVESLKDTESQLMTELERRKSIIDGTSEELTED